MGLIRLNNVVHCLTYLYSHRDWHVEQRDFAVKFQHRFGHWPLHFVELIQHDLSWCWGWGRHSSLNLIHHHNSGPFHYDLHLKNRMTNVHEERWDTKHKTHTQKANILELLFFTGQFSAFVIIRRFELFQFIDDFSSWSNSFHIEIQWNSGRCTQD